MVYRFDFASGVKAGDIAVGLAAADQSATLQVSKDNKNYSSVALTKHGSTLYGTLANLDGTTYVKVKTEGVMTGLKFLTGTEARGSINFRPLGNGYDRAYFLSLDEGELNTTPADAASQSRIIEDGQALVYRFVLKEGVTEAKLQLELTGHYRIAVSKDNVNYTVLRQIELGGAMPDLLQEFDITSQVTESKVLYLRVDKSMESMSKVQVRKIRITTNLNESYLDSKIAKETMAMPIIIPNTATEKALIDTSLSQEYKYYLSQGGYTMSIAPMADGKVVYKMDFRKENADFWKELGLDLTKNELTGLSMVITICNSYKLEISTNGTDWTKFAEETALVNAGANKTNVRFNADDYLDSGVVYVRMSRGDRYNGSDAAVLYQMRLMFTPQAIG